MSEGTKYFHGHPCKHGHGTKRFENGGGCTVCATLNAKKRKIANPEKEKIYQSKRTKEKSKKYSEDYRKRNYEHVKILDKKRKAKQRLLRPEMNYRFVKNWRERNWEMVLLQDFRRRIRVKNAAGEYTSQDIEFIFISQKGLCAICHIELDEKFHRDHKMPLALGGDNSPSNIQLLCKKCNCRKGAKHPDIFARECQDAAA